MTIEVAPTCGPRPSAESFVRTESDVRQVIQRFYDALRRGAVPEVLALLHTDLS